MNLRLSRRRMACGIARCSAIATLASVLYGAPAALASEAVATPVSTAPVPHVALLLPTQSKVFTRHALSLRDGFLAAAGISGKALIPVREYAVTEDVGETLKSYRVAIAAGARVVVGPLTRDAVTALAFGEPVPMPTLALNIPDQTGRSPENLFMLGLQVEAEAQQAARFAWRDRRRRAVVIAGGNPVQQRMRAAFVAEFTRLGGTVLDEAIPPDPARLRPALRVEADMAFLALDHDTARTVRPYLGDIPGYATSGIHAGERGALAAFDLSGITFVDMPWLLEPDHPAVMLYPRRASASAEFERLYALGIDAWRIAELLLGGTRDLRLDGVSGALALGPGGVIVRTLRAGRYSDGRARLVEPHDREPER
jgi:hypothetical protein